MSSKYEVIEGYSQSVWKSLVVKSIRLGWLDGLLAARARLTQSAFARLFERGVFEDILPRREDVSWILEIIHSDDIDRFSEVLSVETYHGKFSYSWYNRDYERIGELFKQGYRDEAVARTKQAVPQLIDPVGAAANVTAWIWHLHEIPEEDLRRPVDRTPFAGPREPFVDMHPLEGKRSGRWHTILCGHPRDHDRLRAEVHRIGWEGVRKQVHESPIVPPSFPVLAPPTFSETKPKRATPGKREKKPEQVTFSFF
ncbi:MAG: hypothetical protein QHG98_07350 [Methanothrix sp.]|jgi:hypothetical protein|nr:hypothetical protein [Methanothrix sp.]